jgi:anti-sigma regulatory factor (Ser/Thr protein kinase)
MRTARLLGSLDLPGTTGAPARARHYLRAVLDPGLHAVEDVTLLVSELVTNAVVHTASGNGGTIRVNVMEYPDGGIFVEVVDGGGHTCPTVRQSDDLDLNGRGLMLVDTLAANWGHQREGEIGKTWFLVAPESAEPRRRRPAHHVEGLPAQAAGLSTGGPVSAGTAN